jgi:hypothetical protein
MERMAKWGREIDYEGWHNSQQVRAWVESWTTVVSAAPAALADLSCKLNVGAATRLDGREKNSTVCIRFLHLRGQKQSQVKNATLELQKGCFQLALEIQKICWPEARKLENSDLVQEEWIKNRNFYAPIGFAFFPFAVSCFGSFGPTAVSCLSP